MKHLCSTPFAGINQKREVTHELPLDVVTFIESTYNLEEQKSVKKKLKRLSTNLHATILSNTTRAISNCVDDVLRAFCNDNSKDASLCFNQQSIHSALFSTQQNIHCNDLLDHSLSDHSEKISEQKGIAQSSLALVKDSRTSTQEIIKEMIYYYMDSSFPPLPEVQFPEVNTREALSTSEDFRKLVRQLGLKQHHPDTSGLELTDVDDFLTRTLVTKLQISDFVEEYEEMTILEKTKPTKEEKIDFSGWFDCSRKKDSFDGCSHRKDITSFENNHISMYSGSIYSHSIKFSTRSSSLHNDRTVNDCPSFSLGPEFENVNSPATPVLMDAPTPPNQHASFKQIINQPNDARPSTGTDHIPSIRSREYQSAMISEHSTSLVQKIDFFSNVNDNSPTKQPQGLSNTNWSSQKPKSGSHNGMLDHTGRESVGSEGVHFNRDSTYGLCFNERMFRPESLKHVQSDNMYTPSDQVLQNSNTMNYGYSTQIQNSHTPMTQKNTLTSSNHPSGRIELSNQQQSSLPPMQKKQSETFVAASTLEPTFIQQHASPKGMSSSKQIVFSTTVEDELFKLLTSNINDIVYGCRIFQIEERWADERTLARCMSNGGYINDFVMNAFIKMFLFDQKMKDQRREKIACLKHITFTEISESLMYRSLDHSLYKKLFIELLVGFRLEHAAMNELPDPDLFKLKHGRTFWELADHDTSFNTLFNHGMVSDSRFLMDIAIRECSAVFLGIRSLVDVAGGHGGAAQAIAKAFPDSKRSVLDLEHVVTKAPTGTAVDYIVGDMFESVPPADAVFLKWIMHDWSDEDCIKILKKLQKSYRPKRCRREGDNHRHGGWSRAARLEAQRDIGYVRFVHHVRKWRRAR